MSPPSIATSLPQVISGIKVDSGSVPEQLHDGSVIRPRLNGIKPRDRPRDKPNVIVSFSM